MEIHKKRCKVKAEQALYKAAKLMLWCTSTILCCLNETIRSFQDTIADFSFGIINYPIPVLFYGFGAIDYSIESTVCCPEIPSFKIAFCRMCILIPEITKGQFNVIRS
jgi:hypothetical protein